MIKSRKFIDFQFTGAARSLPSNMSAYLNVIRDFLQDRLAVDPVRVVPDASLEELGVDSLMLLELFFEFEDKLNLTLSKDLPTPKTVGEMLDTVEQLQVTATAS